MSVSGRLRAVGVLFSAASVGLPVILLTYWRRYIEMHYNAQGIPPEGKHVAAGFMLLIPASILLCLIGLSLGAVAYRKLSKPRPDTRKPSSCCRRSRCCYGLFLLGPYFIGSGDSSFRSRSPVRTAARCSPTSRRYAADHDAVPADAGRSFDPRVIAKRPPR